MTRQFKGVWIPSSIWLNQDLAPIDKCILAEVNSFSGNGRYFFKSNTTMSEEIGVSVATIKRSIKKLSDKGMIIVSGGSRRKIEVAQIDPVHQTQVAQYEPPEGQNDPEVGQNDLVLAQIDLHTNTSTNTNTNTTTNKGIILPFEEEKFGDAWRMWIDERKQNRRKKYTPRGEQSALHKLQKDSDNDVDLAIEMINNAIANTWTGIHPINKRYGNKSNKEKGFDTTKYRDYLDSL